MIRHLGYTTGIRQRWTAPKWDTNYGDSALNSTRRRARSRAKIRRVSSMHGHHNSRIARLVVPSNQRPVIAIPMSVDRFAIARRLSPRCPPGLSHMTELSRALIRSWLRTNSQRVVPANAGTHHPWPQKWKKASAPVPKRESAPYGSLRSQGRLVETLGVEKSQMQSPDAAEHGPAVGDAVLPRWQPAREHHPAWCP